MRSSSSKRRVARWCRLWAPVLVALALLMAATSHAQGGGGGGHVGPPPGGKVRPSSSGMTVTSAIQP